MPQTREQYLVATFADADRAETARRRLTDELGSLALLDDDLAKRAALRGEQQEEARDMWGGVGAPPGTKIQYLAGIKATILGGLVGMIVLLPLAFIPMGGVDLGWRIIIAIGAGAAGGSVGAASYWGGRAAQLEEDTPFADTGEVVGVKARDPERTRRLLDEIGAARVDVIDSEGWPTETNVSANPEAAGRATPAGAPDSDKA